MSACLQRLRRNKLFLFFNLCFLIVHNEKLRIASAIYIKIKKFIIYSIYFADMQTFCKKGLFYAVLLYLYMSANVNFLRLHLFFDADMRT